MANETKSFFEILQEKKDAISAACHIAMQKCRTCEIIALKVAKSGGVDVQLDDVKKSASAAASSAKKAALVASIAEEVKKIAQTAENEAECNEPIIMSASFSKSASGSVRHAAEYAAEAQKAAQYIASQYEKK